jgi:hypothetical protein
MEKGRHRGPIAGEIAGLMTMAEFNAALREARFGVDDGWIFDEPGKRPDFAAMASLDTGAVTTRSHTVLAHVREVRGLNRMVGVFGCHKRKSPRGSQGET